MAQDSKQGFFSSLFGRRKPTEQKETADLASKQKLEDRIRQVLAETVATPELLMREEKKAALKEELAEIEAPIELFPISASVIPIRKSAVQAPFSIADFELPRPYAANDR